jgi:hypothetical protein
VSGSADVAETSFFKINSQGTPLDPVEAKLIEFRLKPIAIAARAIMRAGTGHKYWSRFDSAKQEEVQDLSDELFNLLFKPEVTSPIRTLDIPLGGSTSPVDALSLIIDFLEIAGTGQGGKVLPIAQYKDDDSGDATIKVLKKAVDVANRITGNSSGSLGLHPAVYFYNENGKHSRFLFLGITQLIAEKLANNDGQWFKKFIKARESVEKFLISEKPLIGLILRAITPGQRVSRVRDLMLYLVDQFSVLNLVSPQSVIKHLGVRGPIFEGSRIPLAARFPDDVKSGAFIKRAIAANHICSICHGHIDASKSMSYDHITSVHDGGKGDPENIDLVHPFCNTAIKGPKSGDLFEEAP